MRLLIIEDESLAASRLSYLLKQYDSGIEICAVLESVEDTVAYLKRKRHPDLMLMDIQLGDGFSFHAFEQAQYTGPVIFTTAHQEFALSAFRYYCLDYILKPVTAEALANALNKYKAVMRSGGNTQRNGYLRNDGQEESFRNRFLCKSGSRLFFIEASEISFFQADNKIVYLFDKSGNRFVVDFTLERLETMLDRSEFFRLNRSYIINFRAIEHARPYYGGRLKLSLKGGSDQHEFIVSRERVQPFREWAEQV